MMNGCQVLEFFQYYKSNKMNSGLLELGSKSLTSFQKIGLFMF